LRSFKEDERRFKEIGEVSRKSEEFQANLKGFKQI